MTELKKVKVKRKFVPIELKEGMTVTIRQWDDMKEEFGLNENGNIIIPGLFVKAMRKFCGTKITLTPHNLRDGLHHDGYAISLWMLEECHKPLRQLPDHLKGKL